MSILEKIRAKHAAENKKAQTSAVKAANDIVEKAAAKPAEEKPKKSPLAGILAKRRAAEAAKAEKTVKKLVDKKPADEAPKKEEKTFKSTVINEAAADKEEVKEALEKTEAKAEVKEEASVVEEKPKKRRGRPKKTEDKAVKAENKEKTEKPQKTVKKAEPKGEKVLLSAREFEIQDILDSKMSYEEMVAKFQSTFEDEGWVEFRNGVVTELEQIKVAADMNPGMLRITLTQLNDLYGRIAVEHANFKALLEALTNKEDGICTCIRYQAAAIGANESERRANGYNALTNGVRNGEPFNFVNLIAGTRMKYIFLDSIRQRIKFMSDLCITFLGAMKVENSMDAMASSAH